MVCVNGLLGTCVVRTGLKIEGIRWGEGDGRTGATYLPILSHSQVTVKTARFHSKDKLGNEDGKSSKSASPLLHDRIRVSVVLGQSRDVLRTVVSRRRIR